jgi:hypothetical protein
VPPSYMRSTRIESFRDELSRIRESIADAFKDHAAGREVGPGASTPRGHVHLVPTRLTIMDVMEGNLAKVLPESTLRRALSLMIENRISSVPVVDAERRILGLVPERTPGSGAAVAPSPFMHQRPDWGQQGSVAAADLGGMSHVYQVGEDRWQAFTGAISAETDVCSV